MPIKTSLEDIKAIKAEQRNASALSSPKRNSKSVLLILLLLILVVSSIGALVYVFLH